ncbi:MAG: MBL fold metallo-hydrolase [Phycisphaeraceae bacterium]|nr:MBL fold metallo-hydrolase [Phycisphaeraceae bacterium]
MNEPRRHRQVSFEFLGTGVSSGVPVIGCNCLTCTSKDPRDTRLRCSAALRFGDDRGEQRTILFDAGPDLRQQALRARLERIDALLFTHNHVDHTWGLDELRRFNTLMEGPVDIYANDHTLAFLRRVYAHIFDAPSNIQPSYVATVIPHRLLPGVPETLFGLRITPIPLLHGKLPVLGFRVEAAHPTVAARMGIDELLPLAYCTDVSGIPPESWPLLEGLRTLVLGALRPRKHATHFSIDQAVDAALKIAARETWFIHMNHEVRHEPVDRALPSGIRLAWDGLVLPRTRDDERDQSEWARGWLE